MEPPSELRSVISRLNQTELEVEARITEGLNSSQFFHALNRIRNDGFQEIEKLEERDETITLDRVRYRIRYVQENDPIIIKKEVHKQWDELPKNKYGIRLSVSTETPIKIDDFPLGNQTLIIRERTRYKFGYNPPGLNQTLLNFLKGGYLYTFELSDILQWQSKIIDNNSVDDENKIHRFEIEVEVNNHGFLNYGIDNLPDPLKYLFILGTGSDEIYTKDEKTWLLTRVNKMLKASSTDRIRSSSLTQPRSLFVHDIVEGGLIPYQPQIPRQQSNGPYYVGSIKIDGIRVLFTINELGFWLINLPNKVILITRPSEMMKLPLIYNDSGWVPDQWMNCLFEGELVLDKTVDYSGYQLVLYDCLYVESSPDIVQIDYLDRMAYVELFLKYWTENYPQRQENPLIWIDKKDYYIFSDPIEFYTTMGKLLQGLPPYDYPTDGIVFTPNDVYMPDRSKSQSLSHGSDLVKWKPQKLNTFDLLYLDDQFLYFNEDGKKYIQFHPDQILTEKFSPDDQKKFKNDLIYEIGWNPEQNIPYIKTIRHDKIAPNGFYAAEAAWKLAINPIEESTILGIDLVLMRKYHNQEKRYLLNQGSGTLLDLGSGRGGDISKQKHYSKIYAVEPSEEHWKEYDARLTKNNVVKIVAKAEQTDLIGKHLTEPVDTISMMLSLTFLFESTTKLKALIKTIDRFSKKGTKFLISVMDGAQVIKMLDGQYNRQETETSSIIKFPQPGIYFEVNNEPVQNELSRRVAIHYPDTIVQDQVEWLTDINLFDTMLKEIGFTKQTDVIWDGQLFLNPTETVLSRLYRGLVWIKEPVREPLIENPDLAFKRILEPTDPKTKGTIGDPVIWPERGQLLSDIEFMTIHGLKSSGVVYVGSINSYLAELFSDHKFSVFGTVVGSAENITLNKVPFSTSLAKKYQKYLLINHTNNQDQLEWYKLMNSPAASLDFLGQGEYYGDLYLPIWSDPTTHETRMIFDSLDEKKYNKKYNDQMDHFQTIVRNRAYDSTAETTILSNYFSSSFDYDSDEVLFSEISKISEMISNRLGKNPVQKARVQQILKTRNITDALTSKLSSLSITTDAKPEPEPLKTIQKPEKSEKPEKPEKSEKSEKPEKSKSLTRQSIVINECPTNFLNWNTPPQRLSIWNGFELFRQGSIGDGSCLLHSIQAALDEDYNNATKSEKIAKIKEVRLEFSEMLKAVYDSDKYEWKNMKTKEFSKTKMAENMKNPSYYLGNNEQQFITDSYNIDLYFLWCPPNQKTLQPYITGQQYHGRDSVVLYYHDESHYELILLRSANGFDSVFDSEHSFIKTIRSVIGGSVKK